MQWKITSFFDKKITHTKVYVVVVVSVDRTSWKNYKDYICFAVSHSRCKLLENLGEPKVFFLQKFLVHGFGKKEGVAFIELFSSFIQRFLTAFPRAYAIRWLFWINNN